MLTLQNKIELVKARYDPDDIVDILNITTEQLLEVFAEELEDNWYKFGDIESDIEEGGGF